MTFLLIITVYMNVYNCMHQLLLQSLEGPKSRVI